MTEAFIREILPQDAPALAALWHRVFADPEELARDFLRLLPALGSGVAAVRGGEIVGAAYIVTELFLEEKRAAYLYAVAVSPEHRGLGLGKALTREAAALGSHRGADFVCTLPAEPGLYPWYEGLIGTRYLLHRKKELLPARCFAAVEPLTAAEYGAEREALLAGTPHLRLSPAAVEFEACNCRRFGGGLLRVGEGIAAAYREGDRAVVRELLCPDEGARRSLAASAGAALGAERVLLYTPAAEGETYLAADRPLPEGCVWNLCFD